MAEIQLVDILMITYNRPYHTRMCLTRLLETCDPSSRVWVWHNGMDEATLAVVRSLADHPKVYRFHHSPENVRLREPTNWFWANADGDLLGKVDDDCIMPHGWLTTLRRAHHDAPELGIISAWLFPPEDFVPDVAARKIQSFPGGHQIMRNCWVGGSGYLLKRAVLDGLGPLRPKDSFTTWGIRSAAKGWINGWYFPFLYMDHMDDPRSVHCRYRTEADFQGARSLSAIRHGIHSLADFVVVSKREALYLQTASFNHRDYLGLRPWVRSKFRRITRAMASFSARLDFRSHT